MKKFWLLQQTSQIITPVFVTVLLMTFATIVNAAEKKPDAGWHFAITPYIWLPSITASMKLEQPSGFTSGKMDAGPNNYLDNLDFAGMLDVQAKKGKWSFLADVIYLDFSDSESAQFPQVLPLGGDWTVGTNWELQGLVLELAGAYSAFRNEHSNFDLLAGVRYIQMDGKVKLNITGAPPGWVAKQTFSESESFFDPIVGFKGKFELGKKWHLPYYFDIGGFGADSDLTVQAFAGIGYRFGDRFSTVLGYRWLYYDFGKDSKLVEDVNFYGATLGFSFTF